MAYISFWPVSITNNLRSFFTLFRIILMPAIETQLQAIGGGGGRTAGQQENYD
jgi:hypothetical protein